MWKARSGVGRRNTEAVQRPPYLPRITVVVAKAGPAFVIHLQLDRCTLSLQLSSDSDDSVGIVAPRKASFEPAPSPTIHSDKRDQAKQGADKRTRSTGQTHEVADAVSGASAGQA
jgi:hypothetical protein